MYAVLIVDDEFGLAEMAGELLSMLGYSVTTAINGKLALASLNQTRPDIILLDVMMPIMSGSDVLRALKADPDHASIPVVMMSAAGSEVLAAELRPLIAGFLHKPFTYDELTAVLQTALRPA